MYWPRDLLPSDVPNARVLTYGYDTHVKHWAGTPPSHNNVRDFAWDMLVALESGRRVEPARPLVFVVHSLGGIVVKEMLRRSHRCSEGQDHLRDVFSSTRGIMFFGTPHGGADPRGVLQRTAESLVRAVGFKANEHVLNSMLPSSERLRELRDEFNPIAHEQEWMIHSFQEELGMKALGDRKVSSARCSYTVLIVNVGITQVVDDNSSYLNFPAIETTEHIRRNHRSMCRFSGPEDPEYKKVVAALQRMTGSPQKTRNPGLTSVLTDEQAKKLRESLSFSQIDARHMTIKGAHADTCRWLNQKQEYIDWLDPEKIKDHHGFLWIKGKPGTGKSTLMKFALAQAQEDMKDSLIISFFFNARGGDLEKSTTGMYRSILLQLMDHASHVGLMVYNRTKSLLDHSSSLGATIWPPEILRVLLHDAVKLLGNSKVVLFIDALDECDEDEIRDMISFFEQIGEQAALLEHSFRVCLSSRHYPHVTIAHAREVILEGQKGHDEDIVNYINSELKIGHNKTATEIRTEIQERSSGIFLWVALVVGILNKEYDRGRVFALRKRLREIPTGLHDLFRDILLRDSRDKDELMICLQWILFAQYPLRPEQLYYAVLARIDPESFEPWDQDLVTQSTLRRYVLNSSKGLADVTKSSPPEVQFIHESVRDFLLGDNGLRQIWPELTDNFEGNSHEQLKKSCLEYVIRFTHSPYKSDFFSCGLKYLPHSPSAPPPASPRRFPFVEYAIAGLWDHADSAELNGQSQADFLLDVPMSQWWEAADIVNPQHQDYHTRNSILADPTARMAGSGFPPTPLILNIFVDQSLACLIEHHFSRVYPTGLSQTQQEILFVRAIAISSPGAILTLAKIGLDRDPSSPLQRLYRKYLQNPTQIPEPWSFLPYDGQIIPRYFPEEEPGGRELLDAVGDYGRYIESFNAAGSRADDTGSSCDKITESEEEASPS